MFGCLLKMVAPWPIQIGKRKARGIFRVSYPWKGRGLVPPF